MAQRGARPEDVERALVTSTQAIWQSDRGNWRVEGGVDLDGEEMTIAVDIEADLIVVTVF